MPLRPAPQGEGRKGKQMRFTIVREKLTDGSEVQSVHALADTGETVIFAALDERCALVLENALRGVVDIEVRS